SNSTAATNSIIPDPIRPETCTAPIDATGTWVWMKAPSFVKIYTDSGAAVNLKKSVCSKMIAATILQIQLTIKTGVETDRFMAETAGVLMGAPSIRLRPRFSALKSVYRCHTHQADG